MNEPAFKIMCLDSRILFSECAVAHEQSHFDKLGIDLDSASAAAHFRKYRNEEMTMDSTSAIDALGALAQEHRLALFRLLVQAGGKGMAAGAIAEALGVPNSSLSFHLAQLRGAGLIEQERQHRTIIYRANYPAMNALVAYLMENCCAASRCEGDGCDATADERETA
jgi:DNA-binding transcriptional ArsR family regulator